MKFSFVPMNENYARDMIDNWKYEGEYAIYDYINEEELLLDSSLWGIGLFAVLNENNEHIGELNIEFYEKNDGDYISYEELNKEKKENAEMWIGFGLKSSFTGKGLGCEFVSACVDFARELNQYKGEYVSLAVAKFNQRAFKVYRKAGFEAYGEHRSEIGGENHKIVRMKKKLTI